jgi:plasmid replication initiation protein
MKNEVLKVVLHVSNFEQITRMQNNVNNLFKKMIQLL